MSEKTTIKDPKGHLMAYAFEWLAEWSGHKDAPLPESLPAGSHRQLEPYRMLLAGKWPSPDPGDPLVSIFSQVKDPQGRTNVPCCYWSPGKLDLQKIPTPQKDVDPSQATLDSLWHGFEKEAAQVLTQPLDAGAHFETFTHLLHKWAWAVPCSYGEPGVSLYEEFRALSALVHASRCATTPAGKFLLVGGDIPGIQDFVYTITSKGAAKGLRGRSFFIQLLGDAVVRRLLADLGLPETNVVYAAGGNFMLLAPDSRDTTDTVNRVLCQVNGRLVEAIQGDTALVLKTMQVEVKDLFTPGRFKKVRDDFGAEIAKAKGQPLQELTGDWANLFEPKGLGSRLSCAVCRIEVDEKNSKPLEPTGEMPEAGPVTVEPPRICYLCNSFGELARDIRPEDLWMIVEKMPKRLGTTVKPTDGWTRLLERMTGFHYKFSEENPHAEAKVLAVNKPNFLQVGAQGFHFVANVTPQTTADDIEHLRKQAGWEDKDLPNKDDIRSFTLLAHAAATAGAIERVGILRMDVDGLGWVFSEGVADLTLPKLSALSRMMELFFGGYLNTLVRRRAGNDLYIIYAGGDDLFVVGAWHHLPDLAEAIYNQFKTFTGDNPVLSLSGGITLEGAKFPLYRAADRAEEAEGKAKRHTRSGDRAKDALCFLDTVVGWEDWPLVRSQKDKLLWLLGEDAENRAKVGDERERRLPRALLQIVKNIHLLYRTGLHRARQQVRMKNRGRPIDRKLALPRPHMFFGRWVWMQVYSLSRLADRSKRRVPDAPGHIKELQKQLMKPSMVKYSGLAARWVEYLVRRRLEPWRQEQPDERL